MATDVDISFPDVDIPPGSTVEVRLDAAGAVITKINVYAYTPIGTPTVEPPKYSPLFTYQNGS